MNKKNSKGSKCFVIYPDLVVKHAKSMIGWFSENKIHFSEYQIAMILFFLNRTYEKGQECKKGSQT